MSEAATAEMPDSAVVSGAVPFRRRLSTKLLLLTVVFVMIAELLIFPPSIGNFRLQWLSQRVMTSAAVGLVVLRADAGAIDEAAQHEILRSAGVVAIAVRDGEATRQLIGIGPQPPIGQTVDLRDISPWTAIRGAAETLFLGGDRMLRVIGQTDENAKVFEVVVADAGLRRAMLIYARNIAILSLIISAITAALVFAAINRGMIRPIRNLRNSLIAFAEAPDDPRGIVRPSGRNDELGVTERELAAVQTKLQRTLGEQKRLADLGLAVAKINHDMRNILASAQLISDRLRQARDPVVQAFAPKLVKALDRAVGYTQQVLTYGSAQEPPPARRRLALRALVDEVHSLLGVDPHAGIDLVNEVDAAFEIDADPEQLFRVISNLSRNAVQAMASAEDFSGDKRLTVGAARDEGVSRILVTDTGPGLPRKARDNLFSAFRGSARSGGTGLGLAIALELIRAHGGKIELLESGAGRTVFSVTIPDRIHDGPDVVEQTRPALRRHG